MKKIREVFSDITDPYGFGVKIIVNYCNKNGEWSGNINTALGKKYKKCKKEYIKWHKESKKGTGLMPFDIGSVQIVEVTKRSWFFGRPKSSEIYIANLICFDGKEQKNSYRDPFKIAGIKKGMSRIARFASQEDATLHVPKIRPLKWDIIQSIIEEECCEKQNVSVTVYDIA